MDLSKQSMVGWDDFARIGSSDGHLSNPSKKRPIQIDLGEFLRLYPMRSPHLMWFLGAGASAASGIKTAYHMIWEFKRSVYCSTRGVPLKACTDLADPLVKKVIQEFCDALAGAPPENNDEEYSFYFDLAYPHEADRRKYIEGLVQNGSPSFGHLALASLFKMNAAKIAWTTNFDRMIEDSIVRVFGSSSKLTVATIDTPELAGQAIEQGRTPLCVKLHGDFHSQKLKNTEIELQAQDQTLRDSFVTACRTGGLVVVGYSGRDHSVMESLTASLNCGKGFPHGLFWVRRPGSKVLSSVTSLIENARSLGIDAYIVEAQTFDELTADLLEQMPSIPPDIVELLNDRPKRVSNAPSLSNKGGWPIIRTNAFPVLSAPNVCRKVVCDIGGYQEIRAIVEERDGNIVFARRSVGILAFGEDKEIRRVFDSHKIREFSIHSIEYGRLRRESAEHGLLYDALIQAISRQRPVKIAPGKRRRTVLIDKNKLDDHEYTKLRGATPQLHGRIQQTSCEWLEAARIRLELRLDTLWVLVEPCVWFSDPANDKELSICKEFVRERLARRYNPTWSSLIDGWASILFGNNRECEFRTFGIADGIDGVFHVSSKTGFSKRGGVR